MPVKGFYPSYTVFGDVDDPDFTSDFYVGTRYPLFLELGVDGVLKSYGLKDIKKSLLKGYRTNHRFDRPLGEPAVENQYWEEDVADQLEGSSSQHS